MAEVNPKLQAALALASTFTARQFAPLLRRFAVALRNRDSAAFTDDEVQSLSADFQLTSAQFDDLFSASVYILQQAACFSYDSGRIEGFAVRCGVSEELSKCFAAVWDAEGGELIDILKQRPISDAWLQAAEWRLHMKAAANDAPPSKEPTVFLDLLLPGERPVSIQFNHARLTEFYGQIEKIQEAIDKLT
jgi:hypothetical protein